MRAAVAVVNRVLHLHRIAAADRYVHEVSPGQALVIRAGWGEGEQVAYGQLAARARAAAGAAAAPGRCARPRRERARSRRCARRSASRRCSARAATRCCARSSRCARAWTSTRAASRTPRSSSTARSRRASPSCAREGRQDLALRIDELEQLRDGRRRAGAARRAAAAPTVRSPGALERRRGERSRDAGDGSKRDERCARARRLEAALRARTATGV